MNTSFPSLRIEGGLLSGEMIDRIAEASADIPGQKPVDFGLEPNRPLIDEIASAWNDARSYWALFQKSLERLKPDDPGTTLTRDRWMVPFFSLLGYNLQPQRKAAGIEGASYFISHRAGTHEQAPPIHITGFRQSLERRPESGVPRLAPHSLVQEYLNRSEELWGIVTNGFTLRLLRDSRLIRRQAYIEFDLKEIIEGERFADFALLYRLIHATRLPKGIEDADKCLLEQYYRTTVEQGGRVRDHLRDGVERALIRFGNGFLQHPKNAALCADVDQKTLEPFEYYQQLLRLIYRFLFLMVSEERGLISDNELYRQHYSITRVRNLAGTAAAYNEFEDLWANLRATFSLFTDVSAGGLFQVPPLNGDLFDPTRTATLNPLSLSNRDLLHALWDLSMYQEKDKTPWRRINYAALDVEELGSVYESLLEFQPAFIQTDGKKKFVFLTGTERKSTGSYYTPPELVNELIQNALVPVIGDCLIEAKTPEEKVRKLLSLTVCDPACGSGHFLLAAARRIGKDLAKVRTGDEEPSPEQMRIAIRDVITHCIYGVDRNPLAVDLCKVALWLEGHSSGKPLTFLDHRIRCGDSLVGVFDVSIISDGIPDDAYDAVTGDDKVIASSIKKQNKAERLNKSLASFDPCLEPLLEGRETLIGIPENTPEDIRKKASIYRNIYRKGTIYFRDKIACDLWTASFFTEITSNNKKLGIIPTTSSVREIISIPENLISDESPLVKNTQNIANEYHFFHWPLEFPEVFTKGGFDCILGNPPWDMIEANPDEFFCYYDPNFSKLDSKEKQIKIQDYLKDSEIAERWKAFNKKFNSLVKFFRNSKAFSYQGLGRLNAFKLFIERYHQITARARYFGIIIPSSIYNDKGCTDLRTLLLFENKITELYSFENREKIFPIHSSFKFVILCTLKGGRTEILPAAFMLHDVKVLTKIKGDCLKIPTELIKRFSPDTLSIMEFDNQKEIDLISKIFSNLPLLGESIKDVWNVAFHRDLHHADDSSLLQTTPTNIPIYEGKMIHHFNSFYETPSFWMNENDAKEFYLSRRHYPEFQYYRMAYRGVASSTNETTLIASLLPKNTATLMSLRVIELFSYDVKERCLNARINDLEQLFLIGIFNSYILNYLIRRKISANLSTFYIYQLPIPRLKEDSWYFNQIIPRVARLICVNQEFAEFWNNIYQPIWNNLTTTRGGTSQLPDWKNLTKTWSSECGVYGLNDTKHDIGNRAQIRCEIDAIVAHLYGLERAEVDYILSTFPGVRDNAPWLIEGTLIEFGRMRQYIP
ncbi:MAG: N-6 DNA methylase [Methanolinea sp.]|jgi:phage tail protein X|nr:N-6 DNA methylase [Methanolinea sp.]